MKMRRTFLLLILFTIFLGCEKNYRIEKIEFSTTMCFGTCPVFDLNINNKKEAVYFAKMYNFSESLPNIDEKGEGKYKALIKVKDFENLIRAINNTKFPNLRNEYSLDITDQQTVHLKITYDGGKVKYIEDYGARGTAKLKKVYKIFFDLRENQDWKKIE